MSEEQFEGCEFIPVTTYEDKGKLDKKAFQKDSACKLEFVRIFHDSNWQLGAIVKSIKTKKTYDIILSALKTVTPDDPDWNIHEITNANEARSKELGADLISKIEKYIDKGDTGDWFVSCKLSRGKVLLGRSKDEWVQVKMEYVNLY